MKTLHLRRGIVAVVMVLLGAMLAGMPAQGILPATTTLSLTQPTTQCVPSYNDATGANFMGVLVEGDLRRLAGLGPRVIMTAQHVQVHHEGKAYYWGADKAIRATALYQVDVPNTDVRFVVLDRSPPGIAPAEMRRDTINSTPVFWVSPDRKWYTGIAWFKFTTPANGLEVSIMPPASGEWVTPFVGCSACPVFDNSWRLIGTWHYTNTCSSLVDSSAALDQVEASIPGDVPGDLNGDGVLNADDFTFWFNNVGKDKPGGGKWDAKDFDDFFRAFGPLPTATNPATMPAGG